MTKAPKLRVVHQGGSVLREAVGDDEKPSAKLRALAVEKEARRVQKAIMEEWDGRDGDEAFGYALEIATRVRKGMEDLRVYVEDYKFLQSWVVPGWDAFEAAHKGLDGKITAAKATRGLMKLKATRPKTATQRAVLRGLIESVEVAVLAIYTTAGGLLDLADTLSIPGTTFDPKPILDLTQKYLRLLRDALKKYRNWLIAVGVGAAALLALVALIALRERRR